MRKPANRSVRRRRGTALVEMAISMLLLLLVTLGAVEYSWLFLKQEQIANAARQAARLAATPDATNAMVTSEITTLMAQYGLSGSGYTTTFTPADVATAATGGTVEVQISVNYSKITITNFGMLPLPTTLSGIVTMIKEGP